MSENSQLCKVFGSSNWLVSCGLAYFVALKNGQKKQCTVVSLLLEK